eukprot:GHVU01044983.1.p1 GENE.GHVU01044983.1~~GHVU01044983.1.p1  ORF type:complete len:108 (-),score=12.10 GHVU01044983.1:331-654(-)
MEEELGVGHLDLEPATRLLVETEVAARAAERRNLEGEIIVRLRALGASRRFVNRLSTYLRALSWATAAQRVAPVGGNDYGQAAIQARAEEVRRSREGADEQRPTARD